MSINNTGGQVSGSNFNPFFRNNAHINPLQGHKQFDQFIIGNQSAANLYNPLAYYPNAEYIDPIHIKLINSLDYLDEAGRRIFLVLYAREFPNENVYSFDQARARLLMKSEHDLSIFLPKMEEVFQEAGIILHDNSDALDRILSLTENFNQRGKELFLKVFKDNFGITQLSFNDAVNILLKFSPEEQASFANNLETALRVGSVSSVDIEGEVQKLDYLSTEQQKIFVDQFKNYSGILSDLSFAEALTLFQNMNLSRQRQFLDSFKSVVDLDNIQAKPAELSQDQVFNAVNQIPVQDWDNALGLPSELGDVFRTRNFLQGFATSFGDFTFLTRLTGLKLKQQIYLVSQQIINAVAVLNSQDLGPNPDFAYIQGGPKYKDAPESVRKQYEAIHKELKRNALLYLEQIQNRVQQASQGVDQIVQLAEGHKSYQDNIVQQAIRGNGGGAGR